MTTWEGEGGLADLTRCIILCSEKVILVTIGDCRCRRGREVRSSCSGGLAGAGVGAVGADSGEGAEVGALAAQKLLWLQFDRSFISVVGGSRSSQSRRPEQEEQEAVVASPSHVRGGAVGDGGGAVGDGGGAVGGVTCSGSEA